MLRDSRPGRGAGARWPALPGLAHLEQITGLIEIAQGQRQSPLLATDRAQRGGAAPQIQRGVVLLRPLVGAPGKPQRAARIPPAAIRLTDRVRSKHRSLASRPPARRPTGSRHRLPTPRPVTRVALDVPTARQRIGLHAQNTVAARLVQRALIVSMGDCVPRAGCESRRDRRASLQWGRDSPQIPTAPVPARTGPARLSGSRSRSNSIPARRGPQPGCNGNSTEVKLFQRPPQKRVALLQIAQPRTDNPRLAQRQSIMHGVDLWNGRH